MRSILLDVDKNEVLEVNPVGLQDFYNLLNCSTIEVVYRYIGLKRFGIVCDEEAALKVNSSVSAINDFGQTMHLNNIIVVSATTVNDDFSSLTEDEVDYVKKYIRIIKTSRHPEGCLLLCRVS